MNKNNYYYKKLAQSILFSDNVWTDIVDLENPHDNIYSAEFLSNLYILLFSYYQKSCLEEQELHNLFVLLHDIRLSYPYQTRTEKKEIWDVINTMILLGNRMSSKNAPMFYYEEYQKRYGIYHISKLDFFSYYRFCKKEGAKGIKLDLSQDIFPLLLLFYDIEDLPSYLDVYLLSELFLSTVVAIGKEAPDILKDQKVKSRILSILNQNKLLLEDSKLEKRDVKVFRKQNQIVMNYIDGF